MFVLPFSWRFSPLALLERGLAELLLGKGVPGEAVAQRSKDGIQKVGASAVQGAMQGPNPWRQLKQVANQCSPVFQWVLPSELQAQVQAKVASGVALPSRRKTGRKAASGPKSSAPPAVVLQPDQFALPKGVFVSGSPSQELCQICLSEVGPQAVGVVTTTRTLAEPYLLLQKAVSCGPLALLLLGTVTVPAQKVQFPATCQATGEPALLKALLVQLGAQPVVKHVPATTAKIELVSSAVLRMSVYKDAWPGEWQALCIGPLKAIIERCPPLQQCEQSGCPCPCWHGLAGPKDPEPILEVWGRNFATMQFRPCATTEAEVFSVFLRVPESLRAPLLKFSGSNGTFFEPRDGASKRADPNYSVIWMPKASLQELALYRQTQEHAIGLARTGMRPSVPFLGSHADKIFHAGPLPYGAQRHAVAKTLKEFWVECKAVAHRAGRFWRCLFRPTV